MKLSFPLQLLIIIFGTILLGHYLPTIVIQMIYTISCLFKELLCAFLPIIIFFIVLSGFLSFQQNMPIVLCTVLAGIVISNLCVALSTYGIIYILFSYIPIQFQMNELIIAEPLQPLFNFNIPSLIRSEQALIAAIIISILLSFYPLPPIKNYIEKAKKIIEKLLSSFMRFLPLYITGFLLKLQYDGILKLFVHQYSIIFFVIVGIQLCYLMLLYWGMYGFSIKNARIAFSQAMPSYLTGFGTMSSMITVPVTIECAVKNGINRNLANVALPIMANVHLLGDSVLTPILTLITVFLFTGTLPSFHLFLLFVCYFCLSLFAVSGIPGGGIFVILPLLVSLFNFTPGMISIVTTLYFLMDPFGTAANVMGDGALLYGIQKIIYRLTQKNSKQHLK